MIEKPIVDGVTMVGQAAKKSLEVLVKKAGSIMEAASEKQRPSQYWSDRAIRSIQGKE